MPREHTHCTFCNLIHGAAEVSICHEDADAIAFMDIQPVNEGHVLVVPREHYESLLEIPESLGVHLFKVTMRLAGAIRSVTGMPSLNIVVNSGAEAGQDEPHYHVHIIPRRLGDGFDIPLPFDGSQMPDRTILDAYAARIIAALRDPVEDSAGAAAAERSSEQVADRPTDQTNDHPTERIVAVPTFRDSPRTPFADTIEPQSPRKSSDGTRRGRWRINEGAHGELQYEPKPPDGDKSA